MIGFRLQLLFTAAILSLVNTFLILAVIRYGFIDKKYNKWIEGLILLPPLITFIASLYDSLRILFVLGTILLLLVFRKTIIRRYYLLLIASLLLILVPVSVYLRLGHSLPTVEEGRYFGFANYIALAGRWPPYKLFDNDYYQQFHVSPVLAYITRYVIGIDLFSSRLFWGILVTLVFMLFILIIAREVIGDRLKLTGIELQHILPLASLIAAITPELYYVYVTFSNSVIGVILFLTSLYLLSLLYEGKITRTRSILILFTLLSIVGVFTHPLYFVFLTVLLLIMSFFKKNFRDYLILLIILNILYWVYTAVLKSMLIRTILNYITIITSLLFNGNRVVASYISWYNVVKGSPFLIISWTFSAAITIAVLLVYLYRSKFRVKRLLSDHYIVISALTITVLGMAYAIVTGSNLTGLGLTHLYTLFALYIPYASIIVYQYTRSSKKAIALMGIVLLALASYGIYDEPRYNVELGVLGISKEYEWRVGTSIGGFLNNDTFIISDLRLSSPVLYVYAKTRHISILYKSQYERPKYTDMIIITGNDESGIVSLMKTLRRSYNMTRISDLYSLINEYDLVINSGFYYGIHIKVSR